MVVKTIVLLLAACWAFNAGAQTFIDNLERANALVKESRLAEAIDEYKKVIEKHPENGIARLQLGLVYANIGDYRQAGRYLNEALKLDPESYRAHLNIALVYIEENNLAKALQHLKKSLAIEPRSVKARYYSALVYNYQDNYSRAIEEYQTCINLNARYAKAYAGLAGMYYKIGNKAMALRQVQKLKDIEEVDLANALSRWINEQESNSRTR